MFAGEGGSGGGPPARSPLGGVGGHLVGGFAVAMVRAAAGVGPEALAGDIAGG